MIDWFLSTRCLLIKLALTSAGYDHHNYHHTSHTTSSLIYTYPGSVEILWGADGLIRYQQVVHLRWQRKCRVYHFSNMIEGSLTLQSIFARNMEWIEKSP